MLERRYKSSRKEDRKCGRKVCNFQLPREGPVNVDRGQEGAGWR